MVERVAVLETKLDDLGGKIDKVLAHQGELSKESDAIKSLLSDMDRRLKIVEPVANDVAKWKERAIGARMAVAMIWIMIGGAVASIGSWLMKFSGVLPK
jgi:hypothetical protein